MKSLSSFIRESLNEAKDSSKYMKLSFVGIDGGAACVSKIVKQCEYNAINKTTADDGSSVKIEVSKDKAEQLQKIIDIVNQFISDIPSDKHDDIAEQLDKLSSQVESIESAIKPDDEQEQTPDDSEKSQDKDNEEKSDDAKSDKDGE